MWNKNMVLINNPYHSPTKYNPDGKFCPMGIIDHNKYCILPCFFFDTRYCTYWMHSYNQGRAAKEWYNKFIQKHSHEATIDV